MDERTLKALRGSIVKWEAIVDGSGVDKGVNNCPLCKEFEAIPDPDDDEQDCCYGCPVADKVGYTGCEGTPYTHWAEHHNSKHFNPDLNLLSRQIQCPDCIPFAQAELDFLRSLLPKEPK